MTPVLQAKFQSFTVSSPWAMNLQGSEVVSFKFLPESRTLVFIMRGGEIATVGMDDAIREVCPVVLMHIMCLNTFPSSG